MNLHEDREQFDQLILYTASELNIDPAIVEKDYYVTVMLKGIAAKQPNIIFKGGTSLSKCYKLIKRFSEDIDLNIETDKATEGMRRNLKQNIVEVINEQGFTLQNLGKIRSRRDFNRYEVSYPTLYTSHSLKQLLVIETAVYIKSFPTEEHEASSFIYDSLNSMGRDDVIELFGLQPFTIKVLAMERTFIDKVFAIADYYISGKIEDHSRHIYDLFKLLPNIEINDTFTNLVTEVREVRKPHVTCLSAQDGISMKEILEKIVNDNVYKEDYDSITAGLLFEEVDYDTAITAVRQILNSGAFGE